MWLVTNCKNGVSSYEIHRAIGVTQKTAWFMLQRVRLAMQAKTAASSAERSKSMRPSSVANARNMSAKRKRRKGLKGKSTG